MVEFVEEEDERLGGSSTVSLFVSKSNEKLDYMRAPRSFSALYIVVGSNSQCRQFEWCQNLFVDIFISV